MLVRAGAKNKVRQLKNCDEEITFSLTNRIEKFELSNAKKDIITHNFGKTKDHTKFSSLVGVCAISVSSFSFHPSSNVWL